MQATHQQPVGTVTFLFTDIVGSTEMWEQQGDAFLPVLHAHNAILTDAISRYGGYVMKFEGDCYKVAFPDPVAALRCAILAQAALQRYPWPSDVGMLRVRMGMHTGRPIVHDGDYFGPAVNKSARVMSVAHGGQILLSTETITALESFRALLDDGITFQDLGPHRLKDLDEAAHLHQVEYPALVERQFPPPSTLDPERNNLPVQRRSFIGREKQIEQIASILTRGDTSLLTLTGPEGIGKTRLSVQAAAELADLFPDGVWLVRLTQARDVNEAAQEVAQTLGILAEANANPVEAVQKWVANRRCLLILDDFGNVPQAGTLIRELLTGANSLRCLATAREPVADLEGMAMEVPGLSLPQTHADARQVLESEGGRLFVEVAQDVNPEFELNDRRARPIARLLQFTKNVAGKIIETAESFDPTQIKPAQVVESVSTAGQEVASRGREIIQRIAETSVPIQGLSEEEKKRRELAVEESRCRQALALFQRYDHRQGIASMLRKLGTCALLLQDYSRAVTLFGAAHQQYTELNDPLRSEVAQELEQARVALGYHQAGLFVPIEQAIHQAMHGEGTP